MWSAATSPYFPDGEPNRERGRLVEPRYTKSPAECTQRRRRMAGAIIAAGSFPLWLDSRRAIASRCMHAVDFRNLPGRRIGARTFDEWKCELPIFLRRLYTRVPMRRSPGFSLIPLHISPQVVRGKCGAHISRALLKGGSGELIFDTLIQIETDFICTGASISSPPISP